MSKGIFLRTVRQFLQKNDTCIVKIKSEKSGMEAEMAGGDCNSCSFYVYDEDYDDYMCQVNMDEDDVVRLMNDANYACPYYQLDDEYRIVRKQM